VVGGTFRTIGGIASTPHLASFTTHPGAPISIVATAGNGQAVVSFAPPADAGAEPIGSYTVTASPGGATATGVSAPIVVGGLSNETAYTFTAVATNALGTGPASVASNSVTPTAPGGGGGGGGVPDLNLSLSARTLTLAPNDTDDIVATIANNGGAASLLTHLKINLPDTMTLVGPPAFESGSGCTGERAIDCNIDFVPAGASTHVRFSIRASGSGAQTIAANVTSDRESNPADNAAALTIQVNVPPAPPAPAPPRSPTSAKRGVTRSGTARADRLFGTARDDTLRGLGGNDVLRGLGGNDRLFGGSGADLLVGGPGHDTLVGGNGSDLIEARDGERDKVDCGPGHDTVVADKADVVKKNCENVSRR
jgi:hypothetical protein